MLKYIVVHAGARDYYMLSKALYDRNRLRLLITDFAVRLGLKNVYRLNIPLPRRNYVHFPFFYIISLFFRKLSDKLFKGLVKKKLIKVSPSQSHLIIYSYYASGIIHDLKQKGFKIIIFQVHPDSRYVKSRLEIAKRATLDFKVINHQNILDNEVESSHNFEDVFYDFECVDAIICASSESLNSLKFSGYKGPIYTLPYYSKFSQSYNFNELFEKKILNFATASKIKLLYIGAISVRKGILHFVDHLVSSNFSNLELHICTRSVLNVDLLEPLLDSCNIYIHFNKSDAQVRDLIIDSHFVILPSYVEGFGLSLIESISLLTPVIATANTSLNDLLSIADVGLCYKSISDMVEDIISDNVISLEQYREFVSNCRFLNESLNEVNYSKSLEVILNDFESHN